MDVFGNLAYGLEARGGLRREEIERRVRETADKLELGMLLKMPVTDLSGGEQQRVALGRAMVKDADAYLFDEPLSNLDPKLRHRVRRDIVRLHRAWRRPTVYVTHDQAEAFAMGDRVAVLASGRIEQIGTPPELLDHPASTFVARFVGSPPMNLLPGRLRGEGGEYAVRVEDAVIPVPAVWRTAVASYAKENVTIGFRPDAVDVRHTNGSEGAAEAMRATVTDVEALIGETVVRLETADRSPLAVMLTDLQTEVRPGDSVDVTVDPKRLRLFDPSDDRALIS
jgi:multiple sugar transport system ATP-binding protein